MAKQIKVINKGAGNLFQKWNTAKQNVKTDCIICAKKRQTVKLIPVPGNLATSETDLQAPLTTCTS